MPKVVEFLRFIKSLSYKMLHPFGIYRSDIFNEIERNASLVKFDLGGIGKGKNGWKTINLAPGADTRRYS